MSIYKFYIKEELVFLLAPPPPSLSLSLSHTLSLSLTYLSGSINVPAGSVVKLKGKRNKKFPGTWCVCSWIFSCFRKEEPPIGATTFQNEEPPIPEVSLSLSLTPHTHAHRYMFFVLRLSFLSPIALAVVG